MLIAAVLVTVAASLDCLESRCASAAVPSTQRGDDTCDLGCMNAVCAFDGGADNSDCSSLCASVCAETKWADGACDPECDVPECGWDFGDCGLCSPGCTPHIGDSGLLSNAVCDPACDTAACLFDAGSCVSAVRPDVVYVPGSVDAWPSASSLDAAMAGVWAAYTTIYLLAGPHALNSSAQASGAVTVSTLLCSQQRVAGCAEAPATVQLGGGKAGFTVPAALTILNVEVRGGFSLDSNCVGDSCGYCPSDPDAQSSLSQQSLCAGYKDSTVVYVTAGAYLSLHNTTFSGIVHQPSSLIYCDHCSLVLVNVSFIGGTAAWGEGSIVRMKGGTLRYETGWVQQINSHYELVDSQHSGFLRANDTDSIVISSVAFQYNVVWGGTLIVVERSVHYELRDCTFSHNAVERILSVQAQVVTLQTCDFGGNYLKQNGGELLQFLEATVGNCTFEGNAAQQLLTLRGEGGTALVHSLLATANLVNSALEVWDTLNVTVRDSSFRRSGEVSGLSTSTPLQALIASGQVAFTLLPALPAYQCGSQVSIRNCSNVSMSDLLVAFASCGAQSPGVVVTAPSALAASKLAFLSNSGPGLLSVASQVPLSMSNLLFSNNSHSASFDSVCLRLSAATEVWITDSVFANNTGRFRTVSSVVGVQVFTLKNVTIIGNTALSATAGIGFVPSFSLSSLTITNCLFQNNTAYAQGVLTITSEDSGHWSLAQVALSISNSTFTGNYAKLTGAAVTLSAVYMAGSSALANCSFDSNGCEEGGSALYFDAEAGTLAITDSTFARNKGRDGAAISYISDGVTAPSSLRIGRSTFSSHSGVSVICVRGLSAAALFTEDCVFSRNNASAVSQSSGSWTDAGSTYLRNAANDGAVLVSAAGAVATIKGCLAKENSAAVRGGVAFLSDNAVMTCTNCSFSGNTCAGLGGVLYASENSTLLFRNASFSQNSAKSHAAVLYCHASTVTFHSSLFRGNSAAGYGAIVAYESVFSISSSEFRENTATAKSPGVVTRLSTGAIDSSLFTNQTGKTGAFMFATDLTTVVVTNSTFRNCTANSGGSFVVLVVTTLSIKDSKVSECGAATDGGVVSCRICTIILSGVVMTNIKSLESTGALFFLQSTLTISRSTFAQLTGSVVYAEATSVSIDSSDFRQIRTIYGGAVNCVDCLVLNVTGSTMIGNVAKKGGGVYSFTTGASGLSRLSLYANNVFISNQAVNGGAVFSESVFVTMRGNRFSNNSASSENYASGELSEKGVGGAVYAVCSFLPYCSFHYSNNTFLNNSAETQGGAIRWYNTFPTLANNSLSGNSAAYGSDIASFAVRLALVDGNDTILPYSDSDTGIPVVTTLETVASGQIYSGVLRVALVDQYESIVRVDSSSTAHMKADNASDVSVYGNIQVVAEKGVFVFSNFTMSGTPNSTQSLLISTDGVDIQMKSFASDPSAYYPTVRVILHFRECVRGESEQFEECKPCPLNTFSLDPSQPCTSCPAHAKCYGTYQMVPEKGYWRPDPYRNLFFECPNYDACLGSPDLKNLSLTGLCAPTYRDNLCSTCIKGYSKGTGNLCGRCPSLASNISLSVVLIVFVLCVLAILVAISIRSATRPRSELAIYMKIFMNYLQMVVVSGSINLNWPDFVSAFLKLQTMAANASDQLLSFDCLFEELSTQQVYFTSVTAYLLMPAALLVLALTLWLSLKLALKVPHVLQKTTATLVMVLFILHTSLTKTMFSVFACVELIPGEFWLAADLSVRCWDREHTRQVLILAFPGICVWVLGLPTLCFLILVRSRRHLNLPGTKVKFSFLYKGYWAQFFFWEFVILYRKVILVCASVFLTILSRMIQALSVLALLLLSLFMQLYVKPYNLPAFNTLEAKSILASLITIYTGLYFETGAVLSELNIFLFIIILATNAYFMLHWARLVLPILLSTVRNWYTAVRRQRTIVPHVAKRPGDSGVSIDYPGKSDDFTQSRASPNLTGEHYLAPSNSFIEGEESANDGSRITFRQA